MCVFEKTKLDNSAQQPGDLRMRAGTLSRHSHTLKSRTGNMSMKDSFILFPLSTPGKMLRVVVGLVVIGVGILIIQGTAGFVVAFIVLIPIFAALAGECLICPLFGYTFEGLKRERPGNSE